MSEIEKSTVVASEEADARYSRSKVNQAIRSDLERNLFYHFKDQGLLDEALCHSSYANEHPEAGRNNNERLEFLGDAVLNLVVGHLLMAAYPQTREGLLSRMRAALVNESQLAQVARKIDLGSHLFLGRGEMQTQGWKKSSILADAFEALVAAIYLDGGFDAAKKTIETLFSPLFPTLTKRLAKEDYKSQLQEYVQTDLHVVPAYRVTEESGPDHDKSFKVDVTIGSSLTARGAGKSKKSAEQDAAREALILLGIDGVVANPLL